MRNLSLASKSIAWTVGIIVCVPVAVFIYSFGSENVSFTEVLELVLSLAFVWYLFVIWTFGMIFFSTVHVIDKAVRRSRRNDQEE